MKKSSSTTYRIQLEEVDILNLVRKLDPTIPEDAQIFFSENDRGEPELEIEWTTEEE